MAQRSAVTVDLGALDSLGPSPPSTTSNHIRLHMPDRPAARQATPLPASRKPAPAQASSPSPTTSKPQASAAVPASPATQAPTPSLPALPPAPNAGEVAKPEQTAEHILFPPDEAKLPDEAKPGLNSLAIRLSADPRLYVQLVAYAGGGDASQARRLSLSRALAARSYLVDHGIAIKQIDVRPLGNKIEPGGAPDRIDLVVAQR